MKLARRLMMTERFNEEDYSSVVLSDSPYAYWRLNESSGSVAKDLSGNARDGLYVNSVLLSSQSMLPSSPSKYLYLPANNSYDSNVPIDPPYVDISSANNFCSGESWSIECWVAPATYGSPSGADYFYPGNYGGRLIGNRTYMGGSDRSNGLDFGVFGSPSGVYCWVGDGRQSSHYSYPPIGELCHIVFTYSPIGCALYFNGELVDSFGPMTNITIQPVLEIGTQGWTCGEFNGVIGEFALYSADLSESRVLAHYSSGIGG